MNKTLAAEHVDDELNGPAAADALQAAVATGGPKFTLALPFTLTAYIRVEGVEATPTGGVVIVFTVARSPRFHQIRLRLPHAAASTLWGELGKALGP